MSASDASPIAIERDGAIGSAVSVDNASPYGRGLRLADRLRGVSLHGQASREGLGLAERLRRLGGNARPDALLLAFVSPRAVFVVVASPTATDTGAGRSSIAMMPVACVVPVSFVIVNATWLVE